MLGAMGFYSGGSYALLTEITIHCTGVDALSLAFGLEMICAGFGYLVAPPIAGERERERERVRVRERERERVRERERERERESESERESE